MSTCLRFCLVVTHALLIVQLHAPAAEPGRWESAIARFEQSDRETQPTSGGVVFVGSSSIRMWDLEKCFPQRRYLNRGFGGSQIADATRYCDRILTPHQPRVIVLYAGDNDVNKGRTPEQVVGDFEAFVDKVHSRMPAARVVFLAIKPSLARWTLYPQMKETNQRIAGLAARDSRLSFVDIATPMLGADGKPRKSLFVDDGLHLSAEGYKLWTARLLPHLAEPMADVILYNAKILTVDGSFSVASALAISGDRLLAVGSREEVMKTKGPDTRTTDLDGQTVMPGLMDSHTHPSGASMHEFDHPVPEMQSISDVLRYIKSRAESVGVGEWIWVNQVFITRLKEQRYPTKAELDDAAPKNPVVFSTGPDASVNSLALKLSGIDKQFRVTGSGKIERDANTGEPTGILRGGTKRYLKSSGSGRKASEEDRRDRLVQLLRDYNSVGITAIADRNASSSSIARYHALRNDAALTVRMALSHSLSAGGNIEAIKKRIREIADHPLARGDSMLRIVGVKTFQDGGMLTGSAYMRRPWGLSKIYSISDPRYRGVLFIEKDKLKQIVQATAEAGLQFTAHSVGDGAVHNLVDVYEELSDQLPLRATRPCITHCNFMSKEAVQRMAQLGVVADIQPAWLYLDARTLQAQFGYDRLRYFQPLRTIFETGGIAGGGSDHMQKIGSLRSINPYNPFLGMWITVTRKARWYDGRLHPEEALTREQAIRFYTTNNAYLLFLEKQTGSLEAGKLADLIVLDRDIMTCPTDQIRSTQVMQTYLGGKLVYRRAVEK